jgi:hypothetical protein
MLRPLRVMVITLMALQVLLLTPISASATDGDLLCRNHDVFSNVFSSNGRARTNVCQLNDCPTGTSACDVQVRWKTKCEWVWCTTYDDRSGWVTIDGAAQVSWCQNGKQKYLLEMRTVWAASVTRTVREYSALEIQLGIDGAVISRNILHGLGVAGFSGQTTYEVNTRTVTAQSGSSTPQTVATSGTSWITLSC